MSEQARPVRAWAEYDEWSVYAEDDFDGEKHSPFWAFWTPKTGDYAHDDSRAKSVLHVIELSSDDFMDCGPLRTLRVLLSTGHEVLCDQRAMVSTYGALYPQMFSWELRRAGYVWFDAPHGSWKSEGCSDSESVARAISEAVAWVSEHEGVKA